VQRDRQHHADLGAGAAIIGTTPEVDSVMRRFDSADAVAVGGDQQRVLTLSKL
jgi:hypothetical protein